MSIHGMEFICEGVDKISETMVLLKQIFAINNMLSTMKK